MEILLNCYWIWTYSGAYIYYYQCNVFEREEIPAVSSAKALGEHWLKYFVFSDFQTTINDNWEGQCLLT